MGNTYPHKDKIKSYGARFNGKLKVWELPFSEKTWQDIKNLCESTGGGAIDNSASQQEHDSGPAFNFELDKKLKQPPKEVRKLSGEIPKNLDLKTADFALPSKLNIDKEGISVTQLMNLASQKITEAFPLPIWIVGEIQNIAKKGSSMYLSLADGVEGANDAATLTVSAVVWQSVLLSMVSKHGQKTIDDIFEDGIKIRLLCQVSLYKGRGQLSLSVKDVDPSYTKGDLALKREELIKELKLNGLYEANKRKYLTEFPFKVGLISAEGSRAESDFIHQLFSGKFPGEVLFIPTPMQGDRVPEHVSKAIDSLVGRNVDLIVLTRGGGSAADLRWFDAKEIAYAIAKSEIPVISAIGHHDDNTVAEEISFLRAKTPTAAAQQILDFFAETTERIEEMTGLLAANLDRTLTIYTEKQNNLSQKMLLSVEKRLSLESDRLNNLFYNLDRYVSNFAASLESKLNNFSHGLKASFSNAISTLETKAVKLKGSLDAAIDSRINREELILLGSNQKLSELNPTPWVKKGWTQIYSAKGKVLSIKDVKTDEVIKLRVIDGVIESQITRTEKR